MGNVHHDAEPVHFTDDLLPEVRKAIVNRLVRGRVGPFVVAAVSESHVTDAQGRVAAQHPKI